MCDHGLILLATTLCPKTAHHNCFSQNSIKCLPTMIIFLWHKDGQEEGVTSKKTFMKHFCVAHKIVFRAICVPKIIKVGRNLTMFGQNNFAQFF